MVALHSGHQDASNYVHFDLEVTLRSRDLRSTGELDLMRSSYTYSDAYQREELDGAVIFALTRSVKKLLEKTSLSSSATISNMFTPVTPFLT